MPSNDFLLFAGGSGANVLSQADYAALTSILSNGFSSGVAQSAQVNKVLRQSSIMSAVLAQFIVANSGASAVDDGTTATLLQNLLTAVSVAARTGSVGSPASRNRLVNGGAQIAQAAAPNLSTAAQFTQVDMVSAWASGGAITAGTAVQDTAASVGRTGCALRLSGVTLTGAGQLSWRYRVEAADAVKLKNQTAAFQIKVLHDVGSSVNYTAIIRKPTATDNFTSTSVIGTSAAVAVPSGAGQLFTPWPTGLALGDCSNGLEIEIQVACGAVTAKNFWFTEWQLEEGTTITPFEFRNVQDERVRCQRYFRIGQFGVSLTNTGTTSQFAISNEFGTPMRVTPTVTRTGGSGTSSSETGSIATAISPNGFVWSNSNSIAVGGSYTADARL